MWGAQSALSACYRVNWYVKPLVGNYSNCLPISYIPASELGKYLLNLSKKLHLNICWADLSRENAFNPFIRNVTSRYCKLWLKCGNSSKNYYRHLLSASNNSKKIAQPCKLQKLVLELVLQDDFSTLVPLVEIPLEFDIGRVLQYFESIKILSVEFKDSVIPSPPVTYSSVVNKANLKHLVYVQLGQVHLIYYK